MQNSAKTRMNYIYQLKERPPELFERDHSKITRKCRFIYFLMNPTALYNGKCYFVHNAT